MTQKNPKLLQKTRVKALSLFSILLLLIVISGVIYWFFYQKDYQSTDDAYVSGNQIMITPKVAGNVVQINVEDMDLVRKGDVLVVLDEKDKKLALKQAETSLANAVRNVQQLSYNIKQLQESVKAKQIIFEQAKDDFIRRQKLAKTHSIDKESLQHSKDKMALTKADLQVAKNQLLANQSLLKNTPLLQQPTIQNAIISVKQAWLNLKRTQIVSPVEGYVARRSTQLGATVTTNSPLMAIIPKDQMWLEANFKETQLKDIRIGQPVKIELDLYGDDVEFEGKIAGISMGTGSAFSLLPAQNATGNWIKIIQRVPVRIELDPKDIQKYPLRIGLSAFAKVNTANQEGVTLRTHSRTEPLYATDSLNFDEKDIEQRILDIIEQNSDDREFN
ncbi:Inner membrane protein yibH [Phocoenobacter uteri]|uniref:Inner membrane protein yibH n=2 Tax=Phocoenobacter uteri TaxID=146806 RepID=A0A379C7J2_9PAST|nr:EmrA/EmrK family multidrug efflux transporter periplasmic adaptor subunit [Phocoenobacter uteri]MDG6881969.1 multidrug export protein EmrA [Phocoenobacter uteri]SUB58118.1 Inner membrane protein yibH [Phocoenobacter uteri]